MPRKRRYRTDGSVVKRFDSAANAKPKVKFVVHGGLSGLLRDPFDLRTQIGKAYVSYKSALISHLGGEVTTPQGILIDQAARLQLLANTAWSHCHRHRSFREDGSPVPAFDAYIRTLRELRSVLQALGLERREKEIKELADYIAEHDNNKLPKRLSLRQRGKIIDVDEVPE